ncbi:hypothetical protein ACFW04_003306 [Cataglyphis niger]
MTSLLYLEIFCNLSMYFIILLINTTHY